MKSIIPVTKLSNHALESEYVEKAPRCPLCSVSLNPDVLSAYLIEYDDDSKNKLYLLNYCPTCDECFISFHRYNEEDGNYDFVYSAPAGKSSLSFSQAIQNLSPGFIEIYNDSLTAEESGLLSICGMGYRKALEFLVKDYAISFHPDDEAKIEAMPLSQCIKNYIDSDKIKNLARASSWIGNDEAHYSRKHADYNYRDLKRFIDTIVAFIDYECNYSDALALLSNPK